MIERELSKRTSDTWPLSFKFQLMQSGYDLSDEEIGDIWYCFEQAGAIETNELLMGVGDFGRLVELVRLVRTGMFTEMFSYMLRGIDQYAQWHKGDIADVSVADARWTLDDRLVLTFKIE